MANYRLTLCYDGTRWKGWQKQGNTDNTIQGKLETLLSRLLDQPVEVNGSGRTDAGTHAKGQVASFRAKTHLTTDEILAGLRQYLPADIGAIDLEEAEPRFHARLSCTGKTYVYRIWRSEMPNVFERNYLYFCPGDLNVDAMRQAAEALADGDTNALFDIMARRDMAYEKALRAKILAETPKPPASDPNSEEAKRKDKENLRRLFGLPSNSK